MLASTRAGIGSGHQTPTPATPKITTEQASAAALKVVPGRVTSVVIERKQGKNVYVVEIMTREWQREGCVRRPRDRSGVGHGGLMTAMATGREHLAPRRRCCVGVAQRGYCCIRVASTGHAACSGDRRGAGASGHGHGGVRALPAGAGPGHRTDRRTDLEMHARAGLSVHRSRRGHRACRDVRRQENARPDRGAVRQPVRLRRGYAVHRRAAAAGDRLQPGEGRSGRAQRAVLQDALAGRPGGLQPGAVGREQPRDLRCGTGDREPVADGRLHPQGGGAGVQARAAESDVLQPAGCPHQQGSGG